MAEKAAISTDTIKGYVLIILGTVFLSAIPVNAKFLLETIPTDHFSAFWMLGASVWAGLWVFRKGAREPIRLFKRHRGSLLAIGIMAIVWVFSYFQGVARLDPAVATFIVNSRVIWGVALGFIVFHERLPLPSFVGVIVVLVGVVVVYLNGIGADDALGMAYTTLSAFLFVIVNAIIKARLSRDAIPLALLCRFIFPAVAYGTLVALRGPVSYQITTLHVLLLIFGSLTGPFLSFLFIFSALPYLRLGVHTVFQSIGSVFTAIISFLVLRTVPSKLQIIGGALIVVGLIVVGVWNDRAIRRRSTS